ncbi:hypothetical protein PENANT_c002G04470 [Penicillium antarcticum]|uniref:Uncharacterized protein n=1 Tax=Penicillium antarcticum TaxID=416450 RepID=A0A1V6QKT1_9EURO|nr:hypothetical protein PENANT_c002G04470 [Penicillium antarcticum]
MVKIAQQIDIGIFAYALRSQDNDDCYRAVRRHALECLQGDGRLDINLSDTSLVRLLAPFRPSPPCPPRAELAERAAQRKEEDASPFRLNIVIQVVGSRGDIQPFIAVGKSLKQYGHRVRLATHLTFRNSVMENGLEFFDIGGHPAELMAFMVKNTGLLPEFKTIRSRAIHRHRRDMDDIIHGCWRSCSETGDGTQLHQIPDDSVHGIVGCRQRPFVADAIIANPPSFAHIHCAEKLGIPLTIMFTMPWSPTQAFPHPLANIRRYKTKPTVANAASYAIVDMIHWQGLGDIINRFRRKTLKLDILDAAQAQGIVHRLNIPHAYLWSPALLSKPEDWSDNIDVCGFTFLSSTTDYTPPDDLAAFLRAGPPPIYVGFGSIVVDNPQALSQIIRGAVQKTGQRAIISKGWSGLGADSVDIQEGNNFLLGNCPHDWLFQHVSCVVHHGGAGTTATGLKFGCPTVIIPFFGDQPFWGAMVARDGVGPSPIPYKDLTVDKLADAILEALSPSPKQKAHEISKIIQGESGVENAVSSFHRHLHYERMRCALCPSRPAVWWLKDSKLALSAFAATVLVEAGLLDLHGIKLRPRYRSEEYDTSRDPQNPLSAGSQALFGSMTKFMIDVGDTASEIFDLVSGRRCYAYFRGKRQREPGDRLQRHESTSVEERAGTPTVLRDDWDTEFIFGIYDGISGLITQPRSGLKKAGAKGLIGGVEKGAAGVMLKPLAG